MSKPDPRAEKRARRAAQAAAVRAAQERAERRRRLRAYAGMAALLVLIVAAVWGFQRLASPDAPTASTSEHVVAIGPEDAPHTVVVYEDFLCPYCGQLEQATADRLASLADAGKVRVEYRPFELLGRISDYSRESAEVFGVVLETAGPEVAKVFHDLAYENQPEEQGPYPSRSELVDLAVEAGADEGKVEAALEDGTGESWVEGANQAAADAGVRSTPTVLLDGAPFQDGRTVQELGDNLITKLR